MGTLSSQLSSHLLWLYVNNVFVPGSRVSQGLELPAGSQPQQHCASDLQDTGNKHLESAAPRKAAGLAATPSMEQVPRTVISYS